MEHIGKEQKRNGLTYVRHLLATPLAGMATVLYVTWQLVAEQQLFVRTFLWNEWVKAVSQNCRWVTGTYWR